MNNDLISREALKEDFETRYKNAEKWIERADDEEIKIRAKATRDFIIEVIMTIDNAPTVAKIDTNDIEYKAYCKGLEDGKKIARPQGEWGKNGECPFCSYIRQWEDDKFCGNCGAAMQKGGAENEYSK